MMARKTLIGVTIMAVVLFNGCTSIKELVQPPTVSVEGMTLRHLSLVEATPLFQLRVTNPNPMGAIIRNISYNLKINDNNFINGVSDKRISLPASGSRMVELPVTINYMDVFDSITRFIQSDQIRYDLSGTIGVSVFNIPYQARGVLDIPKLPEFSLKELKINDFSARGATMEVSLGMKNTNPFILKINGLEYGIKLGGRPFITGRARTIPPLEENGTANLTIPIHLNLIELGRSASTLLSSSKSGYELTGKMIIETSKNSQVEFPFEKKGQIPLIK